MNNTSKEIIKLIIEHLEKNPSLRFGQALYNLGVNEDDGKWEPGVKAPGLRDIYNDSDKVVLERVRTRIRILGL
ncbi:MAG: hypothetical protein WCP52_02245 [Bacteroidota bacterium]